MADKTTDNPKGEFVWRMLGSIISSFCREFGVDEMKGMIEYMATSKEFWDLQGLLERTDPGVRPFKRGGAHDFMCKPPPEGEGA